MHIVIACDSFKGSISSAGAATAITEGIRRIYPDARIDTVMMGDGGEGTMEAFLTCYQGQRVTCRVTGPLGSPVFADYGLLGNGTAYIEMAAASGITLVPEGQLDPWSATTFGTGELILSALDRGCKRIILGIGGSATNDGGAGMAAALGVKLLDENGEILPPGGGSLDRLQRIDCSGMDPRIEETEFLVACDVDNPLCGPQGASAVYGPQKGADPAMVKRLDENLSHYADLAEKYFGKSVRNLPGAGAAGGLGTGLMLFCGAELRSGVEAVLQLADFDRLAAEADLIFTGEGRIDGQSARGKVPVGVAARTKAVSGAPVVALVGSIGEGAEAVYAMGIDSIVSIVPGPIPLQQAMDEAGPLLTSAAERVMRLYRAVFDQQNVKH